MSNQQKVEKDVATKQTENKKWLETRVHSAARNIESRPVELKGAFYSLLNKDNFELS